MARKSWITIARKVLGKEAVHHEGDGQYAFVTLCRDEVTFSLYATMDDLNVVKRRVNKGGCCGGCKPSMHYTRDLPSKLT